MLVYQQGEHRPNAGVYFQELKSLHEREREEYGAQQAVELT